MSQINDKRQKKDDEIAKIIIEKYREALQERGDIVFNALPFVEDYNIRQASIDEPLYMAIGRHYYLQDWLCDLDGRTYSVKCTIGPRADMQYAAAPEYKLQELGKVNITIKELDENHEAVRRIATLARWEAWMDEKNGETPWKSVYSSDESSFYVKDYNDRRETSVNEHGENSKNIVNVYDIKTIMDVIAQKTRLQYGRFDEQKVPGDRFASREATGWEKIDLEHTENQDAIQQKRHRGAIKREQRAVAQAAYRAALIKKAKENSSKRANKATETGLLPHRIASALLDVGDKEETFKPRTEQEL